MARVPANFAVSIDLRSCATDAGPAWASFDPVRVVFAGYVSACDEPHARIAHAYRRWGNALSAHVLGEYAAAIVDPPAGTVLLVQDSLGVRPLFFRQCGATLTVASTMGALLAPGRLPEFDEEYVADLLATGLRPFERTPWTGVERLALGRSVHVRNGARSVVQPWSPRDERLRSGADDDERFRALVDDAVSGALPRAGTVVCELSGGLDSTTVLAFAARARPDVEALTLTSGSGAGGGDEPYATAAAAALGVRRHAIDTDDHLPYSDLAMAFTAEPGGEIHLAKQRAYEAFLECRGVDVVLTGLGGDVVFAGPDIRPHHLADGVLGLRWPTAFGAIRRWQRGDRTPRAWTSWFTQFALRSAWRHVRGRTLDAPGGSLPDWLEPGFVRRCDLRARRELQWAPRLRRPGAQYLWQHVYSQAALAASERTLQSRAQTRHPLFHRPLVEFMCALEEELRRPPGDDRVLQRRALHGILPDVVRTRRSKGGAQMQRDRAFLASEAWYRMLTDQPRIVARGWVQPRAWRTAVDRARFGVKSHPLHFDTATLLECWLRNVEAFGGCDAGSVHGAATVR
jgi:asparagine synthase (glutamine-hydrolysing)